jgi:hypothetical protein
MTAAFRRRMAALLCILLTAAAVAACRDDKKPVTAGGVVALPRDGGGGEPVCPLTPAMTPDRWFYTPYLSYAGGLVLKNVRFGPRLVARSLSVPYVRVKVGDAEPVTVLLTRSPTAGAAITSELAGPVECAPEDRGEGATGVSAVYRLAVPRPGKDPVTVLVQQSYRFDTRLDSECEPTMTAKCRRFWPTTTWAIPGSWNTVRGDAGEVPDIRVSVVQKFEFDPDGSAGSGLPGSANLIRDTPNPKLPRVPSLDDLELPEVLTVDDKAGEGRMLKSGAEKVISGGEVGGRWENWHQTGRMDMGLPGLKPGALPDVHDHALSGTAGCSECVHAHWSWFAGVRDSTDRLLPDLPGIPQTTLLDVVNLITCLGKRCWSDGLPQIADGSKQDACVAWTTDDVTRSRDWCTYPETALATDRPPVMYWDATSAAKDQLKSGVSIGGSDFSVGDSYWPVLRDGDGALDRRHGGDGSMFVVPARRLTGVAKDPGKDEAVVSTVRQVQTADGWEMTFDVRPGDTGDQGPYYLRVHTAGDLRLVNGDPLWQGDGVGWVRITGTDGKPVMAYPGSPMRVKAVVNREPEPGAVSLALDAAPDGIPGYAPSHGLDWRLPLRNWRQPLWDALGCGQEQVEETWFTPANTDVDIADYRDVTGDGVPDAIVAGSCPAITASWPKRVFVYDGTAPVAPLRELIESGGDVLSLGVKADAGDRKVTITHSILGPDDPRCCPSGVRTEVYEWRNDRFEKTRVRTSP